MKKWLFVFMALSAVLVGCQKEEKKEPPRVVEEKPKEVEEKEYSGLLLKTDYVLQGKTLVADIMVENTNPEEIPLYTENGKIIKIVVQNEKGNVMAEEMITESDRKKIQPKEQVRWEKTMNLLEESTKYTVTAELLLVNKEKESYREIELKTSTDIKGNKVNLSYLPNEKKTYIYNELFKNGEIKEEFLYFDGSYVQSNSTLEGVKVYSEDKEGLHIVYMNDYNDIDKNIIKEIDPDKKTTLKFPVQVGNKWIVDDVTYEITSIDEYLETPYQTFENGITVELSNGTTLYFVEGIGLVQIDVGDKTMLTLKAIQ